SSRRHPDRRGRVHPLRRRVLDRVDRRINRRRYDAARTVAGFAARLREQVDLDALSVELLAVVEQTMPPTTASLGLRLPATGGCRVSTAPGMSRRCLPVNPTPRPVHKESD